MGFGTVTDRIYEEIRKAIISGQFPPGERLKELEMAKRYNVSQTPVREAFSRLAQEGFIQIDRYRGAAVSSYTAEDFENLYQIRILLELPAIRTATERITDDELVELRDLLRRSETALKLNDVAIFRHLDLEIHEFIASCSGNPHLAKTTRSNHEKIQAIRKVVIPSDKIGTRSHEEHILIVNAMESHDADGAETILKKHILHTRDEVLRILSLKSETK